MVSKLVKTFSKLVTIESESGNESKFANYLKSHLIDYVSKIEEDKWGNLYLYSMNYSFKHAIMLNTHMDTVSPGVGIKPILKNDVISSYGDTILGADSKAGIASFVELLKLSSNIKMKPFVVTLTRNEESGIPTAQYLRPISKTALVPDRGSPIGEIILNAPYAQVFSVETKGKFAYAPTSYSEGKSALLAQTSLISRLKLGDLDNYSTANIGILTSGNSASMTPALSFMKGSIYSYHLKTLKKYISRLQTVVQAIDLEMGTRSLVTLVEYYPGFETSTKSDFVHQVQKAISSAGTKPIFAAHKAVTNANFLSSLGIETVLLSTGVKNQHTVDENISISDLQYTFHVLQNILK